MKSRSKNIAHYTTNLVSLDSPKFPHWKYLSIPIYKNILNGQFFLGENKTYYNI